MFNKSFYKALAIGRPPNICKLFPNSKALIISGKFVNRAILKKNNFVCLAANARNIFIIRGVLKAAERANSVLIIEIAKSEGGTNAYCAINYWNLARIVDSLCNELKISIPVIIHADHYTLKTTNNINEAMIEIPTIFEAGITSFALDASHLSNENNLLTNIKLNKLIPKWAGLETEVGEIKGKSGLSTKDEALFLIRGLNAHNIFPDWIALNNGTVHGLENTGQNIEIALTRQIHKSLSKYKVFGAQHGTSGNSTIKLKQIASKTRTTKANIATALQMISWGLEVNKYGNPVIDNKGNFIKQKNHGITQKLWSVMTEHAKNKKWNLKNYKKLNLPFENKLLSQSNYIKERMSKDVEDFVYNILINVFNAENTAEIVIESIITANNHFPKPDTERIENPSDWTIEKILQKASNIIVKKDTCTHDFDD